MEPLHHRFPQRSWPYQDRRPACTIRTFTARQLRIREPATPRDGEPSSQGIIEFSPPRFVLFFLPPLPPLTIVFICLEYVFSFGFDYFSFGYYFFGFGSFGWLFILSCFWSARLYTLLCWYLLQRTSQWFSSPRFRTWAANLSSLRFLLLFFSPAWY